MSKHTEMDKDAAAQIQSAGASGEPADPDEDEEENLKEIEARERWAEASEGHRLAAHYNLPVEVLEAIEVTEMDTYE